MKLSREANLADVASVRRFAGVNAFVNNEAVFAAKHPGAVGTLELKRPRSSSFNKSWTPCIFKGHSTMDKALICHTGGWGSNPDTTKIL